MLLWFYSRYKLLLLRHCAIANYFIADDVDVGTFCE